MAEEVKEEKKESKKDMIEEARALAAEIKKGNEEMKMLIEEKKNLMVQEKLGGRGEYVKEVAPKTEEEKIIEEVRGLLKGTGLDPFKK